MSMFPLKIRIAFAACLAMVQLTVLPATYVLHIGCEHAHCSHSDGAYECVHGHCCPFHQHEHRQHGDRDESNAPEEGRHDSDECRICRAAFAVFATDSFSPRLTVTGTVTVLAEIKIATPATAPRHRVKGRAPPQHFATA